MPFLLISISCGLKEFEDIEFSTAGIITLKLIFRFNDIIICARPKTVADPPMSFFIKLIEAVGLIFKPPVSKQTPLPTNVTLGLFFTPHCISNKRGS